MTTHPDETTRPPLVVERCDGVLYVDGSTYGPDNEETRSYARAVVAEGRPGRPRSAAVVDFLDAAAQRAQYAEGAFPDEGIDVPPPRRPRVELRQQVDVNGVEVADLVVRVPASAPDTATAVTDAARALHDAALAVVRVLAVEPVDQAGATS